MNTYRESKDSWTAPDGRVIPMHTIKANLSFSSNLIFDKVQADGTKRRVIFPLWTYEQALAEDGSDAGMSEEDLVRDRMREIYLRDQHNGFDNVGPGNVASITMGIVKMPSRETGKIEQYHMIGCSDVPLTVANMILMAPASLVLADDMVN